MRGYRLVLGLGLALALIWGGMAWRAFKLEDESAASSMRLAANLALAFEENILRTVSNIDQSILNVRQNYERSQGRTFNAEAEFGLAQSMHALALHVSIIGEDGLVAQSSRGPAIGRVDLSGQEFFRVHKGGDLDRLFIGQPGADPISKRDAIQFTRRLRKQDGGFGGVLAMSVDPLLMSEFYKTVDLGPHGAVSVVGQDGYLRAGSRFDAAKAAVPALGEPLFAHAARSPAGHFFEIEPVDRIRRAVSYRVLMDYPLIVTVGVPVKGMTELLGQDMAADIALGLLLTALLCGAAWLFQTHASRLAQAQAKTQEEFERVAAAVEEWPEGAAIVDPGGSVVLANRQWRALAARHGALSAFDRAQPSAGRTERRLSWGDVFDVIAGRSPGISREYAEEAEGREEWRRLEIAPLLAGGGGAVLRLSDTTGLRKLEEQAHSAKGLAGFLAQSPVEWCWQTASDFRLSWLSDNFQAMTGLDPRKFLHRPIEALLGQSAPDARDRALDDMQARREFSGFEFAAADAHGTTAFFSLSGRPVFEPDGSFAGFHGRAQDLRQAREAAKEKERLLARLEEAEARLRALLDTPQTAVVILDEAGNLAECSPSFLEMLGLPRDEAIGRALAEWSPASESEQARERISSLNDAPGSFEMALLRPDGSTLEAWVSGRSVTIAGTARIYAALSDLAMLKQAEASIKAAKDKVDDVAAAMMDFLKEAGREIHTQIFSIIDIAHRLRAEDGQGAGQGAVAAIEKTAKRLLAVTGGIMDCADSSQGNLAIASERFDLERLIEEAASLVDDLAVAKGVEIVVQIAPKTPRHVAGDAKRLGRALFNCAFQAATLAEEGEIVIRAEPAQDEGGKTAVLRFSFDFSVPGGMEDGSFLAPEAPGGMQGWTVLDLKKGAGVGGAVLRPLVHLLGGEAGIASSPGGRRSIWITVPLEPVKTKGAKLPSGAAGRRMLVVDDNAAAREALAAMLLEFGVEAERAASGKEALEIMTATLASDKPFEVVFIDQGIQDIDSFEAISRIRGQFALGKFPSLVVMSNGHAPESGPPHLVKPVMRHRLSEALGQILGLAQPRRKAAPEPSGPGVADPSILRGTRILLVDDSPTDQLVARDMLEAAGINVEIAGNGAAAVAMVQENDYEMVLMDLRMPVLGGIEAVRRIRAHARFARLPIIAVTNGEWRDEQEKLIQFGLNDVIFKPVDPDQLYAVIQKWVAGPEARFSLLH
jgi:PAS domain S-box-containing protein